MTRSLQIPAALFAALLVVALASPQVALPQEPETAARPAAQEEGGSPFGIGFQSSWPAWGISGLYDLNPTLTAQAVLGTFGPLSTISGRLLYHFNRQETHNFYGFGTVGVWRARYDVPVFEGFSFRTERRTESVVGLGGGAGVELNWREIIQMEEGSFPPLFSTIDLGLSFANFDAYDNFSLLSIGVGLHYRF